MTICGDATSVRRGWDSAIVPTRKTSTATTPVTFVCSVESGVLEQQAVRLAASIRKWGGSFSPCPILAITPRLGPPLRQETRRAFDELEVAYIRQHMRRPYNWYKFMAKLNALAIAEQHATTDLIVWLDSDTLMLGEPPRLRLSENIDLGVCAVSRHGGTTGPSDANEAWWAAMCKAAGLSLDDLPWVTTLLDQYRVRLYFNSGVFAYRRRSGLLRAYEECVRRILDAHISSHRNGIGFVEQSALSLAAVRAGLRYELWPHPYNFNIGHGIEQFYRPEEMREAHILHYHNYMRADAWHRMLKLLQEDRTDVADWLRPLGPVDERRMRGPNDMLRSAFKVYRKVCMKWHERAWGRMV